MRYPSDFPEHQPGWYHPRVSTYWWLGRWAYFVFILRELSSVFIAWFIVFTLLLIRAVGNGPEQYKDFVKWAGSPVILTMNLVTLFFVVLHAVTWLNLAPRAMVVHFRGKRVPASQILIGNYAAWAVFSAIVAWVILG